MRRCKLGIGGNARAGLRGFHLLVSSFVSHSRALSICRLNSTVVERDEVDRSVVSNGGTSSLTHRRGLRRFLDNVRAFITKHRRRKQVSRTCLASCLRSITLLASTSDRKRGSRPEISLVAIRTTGNLRFTAIFMMNLRRGVFPDPLTTISIERLRRRHHLLCMTVAHTRGRYVLAGTGGHFQCNGVRFSGPDHFVSRVSTDLVRKNRRAPRSSFNKKEDSCNNCNSDDECNSSNNCNKEVP